MNFKRYRRKQSWANSRYHPGIYLEALRKNTKTSIRIDALRQRFESGTSRI
jgi:hypothetical protein